MIQHGKYLGKIEIDGNIEQRMLYVFMPDECMSISDADFHENQNHHRAFSFSPFTRGMFVTHHPANLARGHYFELKGTKVGIVRDGQDAPYGEGKWDLRVIQTVRFDVAYSQCGIEVAISGHTLQGTKVQIPGPSSTELLPPWQFKILFEIPLVDIKNLFNLNDLGWQTFSELIKQHAKSRA